MNKITTTLVREKVCKNSIRYEEKGDNKYIGKVYIKKSTLEELGNPQKITLTLEA